VRRAEWVLAAAVATATPLGASADALPFLPPGDSRLRHLVQFEADEGRVPLASSWPLPTADLSDDERDSLHSYQQPGTGADAGWFASAAVKPDPLRTFDETPREKGEVGVQAGWSAGDYAGGALRISYAADPKDGMHYRFDDSYAAWRLGNWWLSVGQQERWWGPGWDGSLILSNNARPLPSISIDRARAVPFETKWLSWLGPWRVSTFMGRFEDHRIDFPHPLLWGLRASIRPLAPLELSVSRTAQWCRPGVCGFHTFVDVLSGRDNRGVNVAASQEPGNQELAWDARWRLPSVRAAFYYQINGETGEAGTVLPRPRQTTDLVGFELWSDARRPSSWRSFLEFAQTTCGGWSTQSTDHAVPGCAYSHELFTGGYYFRGRVIGDSLQGDGRLLTLGVLSFDKRERSWEFRIRHGQLNAYGASAVNTLSRAPEGLWNLDAKVDGRWRGFIFSVGAGADRYSPRGSAESTNLRAFLNVGAPWSR